MNQLLINGMVVVFSFALASCGSLPAARVGSTLDSGNTKVKVSMGGRGLLFVAQKLSGKADCESLKRTLSVSITEDGVGNPVVTTSVCDFIKGNLVVSSKSPVAKGEYTISIKRINDRAYKDNPGVYAKYEDPDFAGGPDYLVDGARELTTGQSLKGGVSYPNGNTTEWIRLKGRNVSAGLTLLLTGDAKDVKAEIYDTGVDAKTLTLVGTLQPKKKRMVRVRNSNMLVKISAKPYTGAGEYALVRADAGSAGTTSVSRGVKIPVIDCYQVGDNNSIVLLQAVAGVKVNDEVSVFGRNAGGETVAIGNCQVTSIVGSQASCKMDGAVTGYVEYHAEGRISG